MAAKRTIGETIPPPKSPLNLVPTGAELKATQLVAPLNLGLAVVVNNQEDYELADLILGRIRLARKKWRDELYGPDKDHPGPIPLQYASLQALYDLFAKYDKPMEQKEKEMKAGMSAFNTLQLQEAARKQEAKEAEERKLQAQRDELAQKALAAATPQLAGRIAAQAERIDGQLQHVQQTAIVPQTGVGLHSTNRKIKKWEIENPATFINAIAEGMLPKSYFMLSPEGKRELDVLLKTDADALAAYPGVRVWEESGIVGR